MEYLFLQDVDECFVKVFCGKITYGYHQQVHTKTAGQFNQCLTTYLSLLRNYNALEKNRK